MGELREPLLEVVIGFKGVGKTFLTNSIADKYILNDPSGFKGRPVLYFDVNNELQESNGYYGYKAIDFNVEEKNEYKRSEQIRLITAPRKYRIIPFKKNGQPMTYQELQITASTIVKYYRGGMLVLEDMNKYSLSNFRQEFVGMFIGLRHMGVDLVIHFQSLRAIPPKIWSEMTHLRWHKQSEKIFKFRQRISNIELFTIAECIVDRQFTSGNRRYNLWVSVNDEKLINVEPEDFKQGCRDFLSMNYKQVKDLKMEFDESGNRRYKSDSDAINGFINKKLSQYLPQ